VTGIDPLYWFVFVGLFSPGPNVILLSASGARFGARATWPHIAGVVLGVGIIGGLVGFGTGAVLETRPELGLAFQVISVFWIFWLAYRLLTGGPGQAGRADRPFNLAEAVLFQWINPKVWAVALAAAAGFSLGLVPVQEAVRLATALAGINLFVCIFWVYSGQLLGRLLRSEKAWRSFRIVMAAALALSAFAVIR
jgi:threonine/homoserine/homoserine lactone efflux protein